MDTLQEQDALWGTVLCVSGYVYAQVENVDWLPRSLPVRVLRLLYKTFSGRVFDV